MSKYNDIATDGLRVLLSDVVSADRFRHWKATDTSGAGFFSEYVFGEIFWEKSIGRPSTVSLRDGFTIDASREEWMLVPVNGAAVTWKRLELPCAASWWDGKDDSDYWRVPFMIGKIPSGRTHDNRPEHFLHTHIVPSLNRSVSWTTPGGVFGIGIPGVRTIEPPAAVFVKDEGSVYLSFEVVVMSLFTFDRDGVGVGP